MSKERQVDKKSIADQARLALEAEEFFRAAPDDRAERRAFQRANAKVLTREA